jgi:enoyl-CoA hydratase/carnithine racemase
MSIDHVEDVGPFRFSVASGGVATVVFDRPPVNAVSIEVYEALAALVTVVEQSKNVRVVVITSPENSRAWCGGADVNEFVEMNKSKRQQRYDFINRSLPRLATLNRPVIAAINAPVVGVGVILAGLCDLRVSSDTATFACPEIDFGLVAGGGGLFSYLNMPEGFLRELLYTGRRFTANEMKIAGFLNHVVPQDDVLTTSLDIANLISQKSLPALVARKRVFIEMEGMSWEESYLLAQEASGGLVESQDAAEGVTAFLEGRKPQLKDE